MMPNPTLRAMKVPQGRLWASSVGWMVCVLLLQGSMAQGQTLHAILAGDVSPSAGWGKYTMALAMDLTVVSAMLSNNMPEQHLNVVRLEIDDDDLSDPATLLRAIQELSVQPRDTVFFYFTGHGSVDDQGHYFALARGKLYRKTLLNALAAKRPQLSVLISDCCNTRSDGYLYAAPNIRTVPPRNPTPLFRSLFLEPQGTVDITSSSPGESAFFAPIDVDNFELGFPGSIFTQEWTEWADANHNQRRTWDDMVRGVSLKVHAAFREYYPKGASIAKGAPIQTQQTVYPIRYPGMPESQGPKTGLVVRDFPGKGAVITDITKGSPASQVFVIRQDKFTSLRPQQVITAINGHATPDTESVKKAIDTSPQIMRLTIRDPNQGTLDILLRKKY
jgi:hypothetical protein